MSGQAEARHPAPVYTVQLASDEPGLLRRKKGHKGGDFLSPACAP